MSEENKKNNELNDEVSGLNEEIEETAEAAAETEAAEDAAAEQPEAAEIAEAEEAVEASEEPEETAEASEAAESVDTAADAEGAEETEAAAEHVKKKLSVKAIIGIVAAVVVIAAASIFAVNSKDWFNPYTKDYVDVDGITIGEIADQMGMELSDFLAYYDLPEDMPESTPEKAAFYNIPSGKYAEMNGLEFSELAELLGWDESITEETTIGDALDKTKLSNYVGEENLEAFKEQYGLDDSVTGDTLWGEVRNIVDTKTKEEYEAAQNPTEEPTEEPAEEATEAAADQATAEAADAAAAAATEAAAQ